MSAGFACLAIDTATERCSVAACAGAALAERDFVNSRAGSERIYAVVADVLDDVGLALADLDCLALGCGPGGFTGLRVGAAAIQALAYGANKPVAVVSSLAAIAQGAGRAGDCAQVGVCLDARMEEAYFGLYATADAGAPEALVADCLIDPAKFEIDGKRQFVAAGPGWQAYPDLSERHAARIAAREFDLMPAAADILSLARHQFDAGRTVAAEMALPNYIREKVTQ